MRIAIVGAGSIGSGLARAWRAAGHDIVLGLREPAADKAREQAAAIGATAATVAAAAAAGEVVVLAVPFGAVEEVLPQMAPHVAGKVVIDCTNAIAPGLQPRFDNTTSAAEEIAKRLPGARVVKAFNGQGAENLADPVYHGMTATNFLCGDDAAAKTLVSALVAAVGLEPLDVGPLAKARLLEPLALLWITTAGVLGDRDIAFKLLRRQVGH